MEVEIELKSFALSGDIYELRKYLEENIEGLRLEVKTQPAQEGQMMIEEIGIGLLYGILEGVGREGGKVIVDRGKKIIQLIRGWSIKNNKQEGREDLVQPLGPGVSLDNGDERVYITEDEKGNPQVFDNFNFAIDAKHTYALLIGVSEFESDFPPIPPIRNNLVDFYNLLVDKRHVGLPRQNIQVVFNKTDHEIEEAMLGISRIRGMETLIIYYSGHGHKSDVRSLTLTARNTKKIGDVILGGIDLSFITDKVLRPSTASQKILILDACHSGIAAQGDDEVVRLIDVKGTYTLTSSGDEASYFDKQAQNTYFTGAMLELLRKGTDDITKEMLSLEDIYELSSQKLVAERFPKPNSKNQLNIPAADFLLARNPSFSEDKLKQKAALLKKQGKLQEANHEYIILLKRYPDDAQLRKQADECRAELRFTGLVDEGDQLYFIIKDYKRAFEKYKEALQIKDDVTVATRISKCEEYIRAEKEKSGKIAFTGNHPIKEDKKIKPPHVKPIEPIRTPTPPKREPVIHPTPPSIKAMQSANKKTWTFVALGWFVLSTIYFWTKFSPDVFSSPGFSYSIDLFQVFFNHACLPFLIIAAVLIGIRNKKISTTEILIYITGLLSLSYIYTVKLTSRDNSTQMPLFLLIIPGIAFLVYFRKALSKFSALDFVIACIPLLYFSVLIFVLLLLTLFKDAAKDDAAPGIAGFFSGVIATIVTIFLFFRIWKRSRQ